MERRLIRPEEFDSATTTRAMEGATGREAGGVVIEYL